MNFEINEAKLLSLFCEDVEIAIIAAESFLKSYPKFTEEIFKYLNLKRSAELKSALHAFKGAVSLFDLPELVDKIQACENYAKNDMIKESEVLFLDVKKETDFFALNLEIFCSKYSTVSA